MIALLGVGSYGDRRRGVEGVQGPPAHGTRRIRTSRRSPPAPSRAKLVRRRDAARVRAQLLGARRGRNQQAHVHFGKRGDQRWHLVFPLLEPRQNGPAGTPACPGPRSGTVGARIEAADVIGPNTPPPATAGQGIEPGGLAEILAAMRAGSTYANVHTTKWPGGEIRARSRAARPAATTTTGGRDDDSRAGNPDSRRAITSSVNAVARAPSTTRWSNVTETLPMRRTTISPSRTTGRGPIRCKPRMRTSGWLRSGVTRRPPSLPALVTVNVPPRSSSGFSVPARAASARRSTSAASSPAGRRVAAAHDRNDQTVHRSGPRRRCRSGRDRRSRPPRAGRSAPGTRGARRPPPCSARSRTSRVHVGVGEVALLGERDGGNLLAPSSCARRSAAAHRATARDGPRPPEARCPTTISLPRHGGRRPR